MNSRQISEFKVDQRRFLEEKISILNPISKLVVNFDRQYGILSIYNSPYSENIIAKIYLPKTLRTIVMLIHPQEFMNNEKSTQKNLAKKWSKGYQTPKNSKFDYGNKVGGFKEGKKTKMKFGEYASRETANLRTKNMENLKNNNMNINDNSPIYKLTYN